MVLNMNKMVNFRLALGLMFVFSVTGCQMSQKMTDDTIVNSSVDGVAFSHRYAVKTPERFTLVDKSYRALYPSTIMTTPDFSGNEVGKLESGETYTVIAQVENNWLALGEHVQNSDNEAANKKTEQPEIQVIGYVQSRAVVKSELYEKTLKADRPKRRYYARPKKTTCVSVDGHGKACQNSNSGTWVID